MWHISLSIWLHIFCKIYLNKPGICLIKGRQLQCHIVAWADYLDCLWIKREKKAFLDLFLTTISVQDKLTTLLVYKGNLDNYRRCSHLQLHCRFLHLAKKAQSKPKRPKTHFLAACLNFLYLFPITTTTPFLRAAPQILRFWKQV